jgi:hypothetical protein
MNHLTDIEQWEELNAIITTQNVSGEGNSSSEERKIGPDELHQGGKISVIDEERSEDISRSFEMSSHSKAFLQKQNQYMSSN